MNGIKSFVEGKMGKQNSVGTFQKFTKRYEKKENGLLFVQYLWITEELSTS